MCRGQSGGGDGGHVGEVGQLSRSNVPEAVDLVEGVSVAGAPLKGLRRHAHPFFDTLR